MDEFDRQVSRESQRAEMLDLLRGCDQAILVTITGDRAVTRIMHLNDIELLGLVALLARHIDCIIEERQDDDDDTDGD